MELFSIRIQRTFQLVSTAKVGIVWKNLGICLPEIWEEYKYTNIFHLTLPSWSIPE